MEGVGEHGYEIEGLFSLGRCVLHTHDVFTHPSFNTTGASIDFVLLLLEETTSKNWREMNGRTSYIVIQNFDFSQALNTSLNKNFSGSTVV